MLDHFGNKSSKLFHQLIKLVSQEPKGRAGGRCRTQACQVSYGLIGDGNIKQFPSHRSWRGPVQTPPPQALSVRLGTHRRKSWVALEMHWIQGWRYPEQLLQNRASEDPLQKASRPETEGGCSTPWLWLRNKRYSNTQQTEPGTSWGSIWRGTMGRDPWNDGEWQTSTQDNMVEGWLWFGCKLPTRGTVDLWVAVLFREKTAEPCRPP